MMHQQFNIQQFNILYTHTHKNCIYVFFISEQTANPDPYKINW
jgi:hypothetical protein